MAGRRRHGPGYALVGGAVHDVGVRAPVHVELLLQVRRVDRQAKQNCWYSVPSSARRPCSRGTCQSQADLVRGGHQYGAQRAHSLATPCQPDGRPDTAMVPDVGISLPLQVHAAPL